MTQIKDRKYAPRYGKKTDVFSKELCEKIRKRLKLTEEQLPDKIIQQVTTIGNQEIGKWVLDNQEGYVLNKMGAIAISKYLPKEMRVDKDDILEAIQNYKLPDYAKKIYLKRYNVEIGDRIDLNKVRELEQKIPHMNPWSFFYVFRFMWFNQRNCEHKKALAYYFEADRPLRKELRDRIFERNADYYEYTFDQWYNYKIKPV